MKGKTINGQEVIQTVVLRFKSKNLFTVNDQLGTVCSPIDLYAIQRQ